jgi:hypothetical protein
MINAAQIPRGLIKSGGKLVGDATKGFLESDLPAAVGTIGAASRGGMETVEQTQDRKISEVEAIKADPSHPMHDMIAKLPVDQAATQLNMMEGMPGVGSIRNVGRYGNLEFNPNKFKAMSGRNAKIAPGLAQPEAGSYRVLAREFTPAYGEPYIQEVVKLKDGSYKQILRDKSGEIIKSIDVNRPENTVSQTYQRGTYGEMGGHNENNRQLKRAIIENEPSDSYDVGYDFERAIRTNSNPVADIRTLDQSKRKGLLQNNPFEEKGQVIEAKEGLRPHYNKISEENMTRRETERMEKAIEGFLENPKKLSEKDYLELRLRSLGDSPYRGSHYMADIDPSLVKAIKSEYKDLAGKIKSPKGKLIRAEDVFDLWSGRPNPPGKKGKLIDRSRGLKSDD